jgi:hypothetical protein
MQKNIIKQQKKKPNLLYHLIITILIYNLYNQVDHTNLNKSYILK